MLYFNKKIKIKLFSVIKINWMIILHRKFLCLVCPYSKYLHSHGIGSRMQFFKFNVYQVKETAYLSKFFFFYDEIIKMRCIEITKKFKKKLNLNDE